MAANESGVNGGKRKRGKRGGVKHRAKKAGMVSVNEKALVKMLSSWTGARESERRGYVRLPSANPEQALTARDRLTIAQKVRAGEQNVGLVKRAIEVPARLIGNLKPQANTGDESFDAEVEELFWRRADHAAAFDAAG